MIRRIRYLVGTLAVLLLVTTLFPSVIQAQEFSLVPAEVHINNLLPGEEAEFSLTIWNKDDVSHIFTMTTYNPDKSERRPGRTEFPDTDWISFSPQRVEVDAASSADVKVVVAIPSDYKSTGKDWEVWLGVALESSDLLTVKLYERLLISSEGNFPIWPIVGIAIAVIFVGYGVFYFRHRLGLTSPDDLHETPSGNSPT